MKKLDLGQSYNFMLLKFFLRDHAAAKKQYRFTILIFKIFTNCIIYGLITELA